MVATIAAWIATLLIALAALIYAVVSVGYVWADLQIERWEDGSVAITACMPSEPCQD
jgi:hypothetical protein